MQDSTIAINLFAGNYTVTVTDANGCSRTASTFVSQPPVIVVQTTATDAHCSQSDGSATVFASGGVPGFSYEWTTVPSQTGTTISNLIAGIYGVIVTDATGCSKSAFANVNNITGMILNIDSIKGVTCFGSLDGYAAVSVANSSGPLSYFWLPSMDTTSFLNGLPGGNVSITVTDNNNCQVSTVIAIPEPSLLTTVGNLSSVICNGDSTFIGGVPGASGGNSPYTFQWSPSNDLTNATIPAPIASPNSTTIYTLTVTDSRGCQATATDTVLVNTISPPIVFLLNDTLFSTAAPYFQWYFNGNLIPGANTSFFIPVNDGDYTLIVSDSNNCQSSSTVISVILNTSKLNISDQIIVYPNPSTGEIFIEVNLSDDVDGIITTLEGMQIKKLKLQNGMNKVETGIFRNGNYILHLSNKERHFSKIITVIN